MEVPDGTYSTRGHRNLAVLRGTEDRPIVLRAAHRGQSIIVGETGFVLSDCAHVVVEGFVFEKNSDQQCIRLENCPNVGLTRNIFRPRERKNQRRWEHCVYIVGARNGHNRIDHNLFRDVVFANDDNVPYKMGIIGSPNIREFKPRS